MSQKKFGLYGCPELLASFCCCLNCHGFTVFCWRDGGEDEPFEAPLVWVCCLPLVLLLFQYGNLSGSYQVESMEAVSWHILVHIIHP